jgi:DNA-binding IclR family transcriptional regulator
MITSDAQLHQAQTDIQILWRFLEAARATQARLDYPRLAAPYLLQLQARQQEVSEYLTRQTDVTKVHHMA